MNSQREIPIVLIVDDDPVVHAAFDHFGKTLPVPADFVHASDVAEAVEYLNATCFDSAVIDVRLPGVTGISLGALVREHDVNIPLAYLTNLDTVTVRAEAVAQRALFLSKFRYFGSDGGMRNLLQIVLEMTNLNPCLKDGKRIDNHGFARRLPQTPIELPGVLLTLLNYNKALAAAA